MFFDDDYIEVKIRIRKNPYMRPGDWTLLPQRPVPYPPGYPYGPMMPQTWPWRKPTGQQEALDNLMKMYEEMEKKEADAAQPKEE